MENSRNISPNAKIVEKHREEWATGVFVISIYCENLRFLRRVAKGTIFSIGKCLRNRKAELWMESFKIITRDSSVRRSERLATPVFSPLNRFGSCWNWLRCKWIIGSAVQYSSGLPQQCNLSHLLHLNTEWKCPAINNCARQ